MFEQLDAETKKRNKIKLSPKFPRYDCTGVFRDPKSTKDLVGPLSNQKNQCNVSVIPARLLVNADPQRRADRCIKSNVVGNLSSLYYYDVNNGGRYFGNANRNRKLTGGDMNPLYHFREDLMLFWFVEDEQKMIVIVLKGGIHFAQMLYPRFCQGLLDEAILDKISRMSNPFSYE